MNVGLRGRGKWASHEYTCSTTILHMTDALKPNYYPEKNESKCTENPGTFSGCRHHASCDTVTKMRMAEIAMGGGEELISSASVSPRRELKSITIRAKIISRQTPPTWTQVDPPSSDPFSISLGSRQSAQRRRTSQIDAGGRAPCNSRPASCRLSRQS